MCITPPCIVLRSVSISFGERFPRNSLMYLSTAGTLHKATPGLGWSFNRASRSSFVRQRHIRLPRYPVTNGCGVKVPSLSLTRDAGSNSWTEGRSDNFGRLLAGRFVLGIIEILFNYLYSYYI